MELTSSLPSASVPLNSSPCTCKVIVLVKQIIQDHPESCKLSLLRAHHRSGGACINPVFRTFLTCRCPGSTCAVCLCPGGEFSDENANYPLRTEAATESKKRALHATIAARARGTVQGAKMELKHNGLSESPIGLFCHVTCIFVNVSLVS